MKKVLLVALILRFTSIPCIAQIDLQHVNLENQANNMGEDFVNGDYKNFARYIYPPVLKSMGGTVKIIEFLNEEVANMRKQGMKFSRITFDVPSKIFKNGNELQATIAQKTEIRLLRGILVTTSTLIAVSADVGKRWTFFDTSNKDMPTIRRFLPGLSPSITIPSPKSAAMYNYK